MNNIIIGLSILGIVNTALLIYYIMEVNYLNSKIDINISSINYEIKYKTDRISNDLKTSMNDVQKRFNHSQDFFDDLLDYFDLELEFRKPKFKFIEKGK